MINKFIRFYNTVKYLKFKQIVFRIYYFIRNKYRKTIGFNYSTVKKVEVDKLNQIDSIASYTSYENGYFNFLNISHKFQNSINWNHSEYGKLWTYNLNYFDFLNQEDIRTQDALDLIYDFINKEETLKDAIEPFPISLRGINWIKFLTNNKIDDENINQILYKHYNILLDNLEYHLLGNHLLENAFSLLFAAYYFQDEKFYKKSIKILKEELEEQILKDGTHFELSPMYHQIMLFRVLDCINMVKNNNYKNQELLEFLTVKAEMMLIWLNNITYKNGDIPLLNDSANGIAPASSKLFKYANNLKLNIKDSILSDSGYRTISNDKYECIVDIGSIGPSYIPGHAHADTFSFELRIDGKPFIVDSGLSTYETNERRYYERGTSSHNTVEIFEKDSSEVWGGFRVANRANIIELNENKNYIEATHDGYKKYGVFHTRSWKFENNKIIIEDSLNKSVNAISRLHFHPDINEHMINKHINVKDLEFKILDYKYAKEFNKLIDAKYIEIRFSKDSKVEIII